MKTNNKVLLIGWDAADWKFLTPLMDEGVMPNLSKLVTEGVKGRLATLDPPLSPTLWTSIATGKRPYKHGIHGFTETRPDKKGIRPIYNSNRKVKALWNMLSENKLKSNVVAWWPSHPAEEIEGTMISNFYQRANNPIDQEWPLLSGTVFPKGNDDLFAALRVHPGELTEAHILPFVPNAHSIDQNQDTRLQSIAKITADCATVQSAATYLIENEEWDLTAVYFDGIDHYCHGFMKYHPPYRPHIPKKDYDLYKDVVRGACIFHDMMLGKLVSSVCEETTIIVISDHGFHPDHNRPVSLPSEPAGPAYEHSPYGIIVMKGPNIKKDNLIFGASLLDIAPTILSLFNLPIGKDMDGKVLVTAFDQNPKLRFIDSWENGEKFSPSEIEELSEEEMEKELKQLIQLGYIKDPGEDYENAIKTTEDENNYYLARSFFDGGKWEEGIKILEKLHLQNPNSIRYAVRLIHGYQIIGLYSKARKVLKGLRTTISADVIELDMLEGTLLLAENKPKKALEIFNKIKDEAGSSTEISLKISAALIQIHNYKLAEEILIKITRNELESEEALLKLGICYFHQGKFEKAANSFLETIGLTYYNPSAHYYLAESLIGLEKYTDAADALEVCLKLAPGMNVAREKLIFIYNNHLNQPGKSFKYFSEIKSKNQGEIIIVSGLPRSGTSMMMQILAAGGMELFVDDERLPDENNPKGFFEHQAIKSLPKNKKWVSQAKGKCMKVIAQLLDHLPSNFNYKVIFMEREILEVVQSQQRMLSRNGKKVKQDVLPLHLVDSYEKTISRIKEWAKAKSNVEIIYVKYSEVVQNPFIEAMKINEFLDGKLIPEKMTTAVDSSLHREKIT